MKTLRLSVLMLLTIPAMATATANPIFAERRANQSADNNPGLIFVGTIEPVTKKAQRIQLSTNAKPGCTQNPGVSTQRGQYDGAEPFYTAAIASGANSAKGNSGQMAGSEPVENNQFPESLGMWAPWVAQPQDSQSVTGQQNLPLGTDQNPESRGQWAPWVGLPQGEIPAAALKKQDRMTFDSPVLSNRKAATQSQTDRSNRAQGPESSGMWAPWVGGPGQGPMAGQGPDRQAALNKPQRRPDNIQKPEQRGVWAPWVGRPQGGVAPQTGQPQAGRPPQDYFRVPMNRPPWAQAQRDTMPVPAGPRWGYGPRPYGPAYRGPAFRRPWNRAPQPFQAPRWGGPAFAPAPYGFGRPMPGYWGPPPGSGQFAGPRYGYMQNGNWPRAPRY